MKWVWVVGLALVVGCSGGGGRQPSEATEPLIDGVPASVYDAAVEKWGVIVGEWNRLTLERDNAGADAVVVNGQSFDDFEHWAVAQGYQFTFEAFLAAEVSASSSSP